MPSNPEFVLYVCDQISDAGEITYRKMMGEYCVYCNQKVIGLICDNQFFLKITDAGRALLTEINEQPAYKGAKPSFLIEALDDRAYISEVVRATYEELPAPKPKKKKIKLDKI